ncbi:hypothetical protein CAEBREN_22982 [Caenorhabditis brenneri]|uniref:Uncharacterized protein n=1 Tax=Caenorhabditis brenneri TaxID=135651 RepID=G0P4T0_CAEBE|nr:hypothetical protein CAEBREN_22982 [Caenorhabditis brenneri]
MHFAQLDPNATAIWFDGSEQYSKNLQKALINLPFPIILIVLYILKMKKFRQFSPFLPFHSYMYFHVLVTTYSIAKSHKVEQSIFLIIGVLSTVPLAFGSYILSCFIILQMLFVIFKIKFIHVALFDTKWNRPAFSCLMIPVFVVLRVVNCKTRFFLSEWLVFDIWNKEVKFDFFLLCIDVFILCLIFTVFLQWKFFRLQIDEKGFSIIINSILSLLATLTYRIITIIRTIFTETPDIPFSVDKFIFNLYYCPFLWILTVYLCNWSPVKAWVQRKVKENDKKEEEVIPEFQMTYIPVGGSGNRRGNREEETVISYLSVSDISVVV